jgi:hypothetical protein
MITPPLSISAMPRFTREVPVPEELSEGAFDPVVGVCSAMT